jgi:hypothetical protein
MFQGRYCCRMPSIQIDPIDSLSLTLHHSPGVQALLLGSGISRSAGVPTGWEVTLDLIRRLGSVQGVLDQEDWAAWYRETYKKEPSYSEILDGVATAPAERRSIIHGYIEAQDGEEPRQPTVAHRAIANLVALGSIRVILTTNFDRLLENALRNVGIEPTVIGSDDAILGATPLVHSRCTVIKLHGDYMDARIKNTQDELETYSPAMDALLDRVLDEYGLIIAGWSGDWDTALRAAITRTASRRFPLYWASRGTLSQLGSDLLTQRAGKLIPITDADSFFVQLTTKVEALAAMNRAHPESIALLVAEGKKLCRDDLYSAEWTDLLAREVSRFSDWVRSAEYFQGTPNNASINDLVKRIVAKSEGLRRLVMIGARWGTDEAFRTTLRAITAITFRDMDGSGFSYVISLRLLGASLCFQWGVAASLLSADAFGRAARLMHLTIPSKNEKGLPAVSLLPFAALDTVEWKILEGFENRHTPHSDYFSKIFASEAKDIVVGPNEPDAVWDDSEFLIAAESGYQRLSAKENTGLWFWVPVGRFVWRREGGTGINQRMEYLGSLSPDSPELKAGLFGGGLDGLNKILPHLTEFVAKASSRYSW